jgi:uncharacterized membrane protein
MRRLRLPLSSALGNIMSVPNFFRISQIITACIGLSLIINRFLENSISNQVNQSLQNWFESFEKSIQYVTLAIFIISAGIFICSYIKNRKSSDSVKSIEKDIWFLNFLMQIGALLVVIKLLYVA